MQTAVHCQIYKQLRGIMHINQTDMNIPITGVTIRSEKKSVKNSTAQLEQ